ncbi:MAG: 1,4-alpha-glucan branching protein GlgB [Ruminococcaceae bacterium]|nr:1,4-alpha-glucan branching protein GlgB [Oscillospiraceae bacterium]
MSEKYYSDHQYLFHQGTSCNAHDYLGAHIVGDKIFFRVWAPNAECAYVVGSFNSWDDSCEMSRVTDMGIWELSLPADRVSFGDIYKYKFINKGREIYKSDPYGVRMDSPPHAASIIYDIEREYAWHDEGWMSYRRQLSDEGYYSQPMNIYEIHMGSWKRHEDGSYFNYKEMADDLAPYLKQMGYTHVELMPVSEHPFDGSWGYQVGGYFAPTSRFGTPHQLMNFVDIMHTAGIGVIMDWVPAHFPKDAFGLYEFDGQPLYEYQGADRIEHSGWGTRRFDVGRQEVQSFLVSNAFYWIEKYHIDGIRVDAVASMLYLDYDRMPGEWIPNVYGDNRCLEAIAFFKKLNSAIKDRHPDVLTIAEESGAQLKLTGFENDGLGFDMKWNMGWMNDTLFYAEKDPVYRKYHHDKITFSLMYAFSEKFVLPISHDEVVHGKKSFVDKMPGDYWRKFAGARVFLAWQMTHPGKKLTFMGNEIAQFREWDYDASIEWFMLDYDMHAKYQLYCARLNNFYLQHPELWQVDDGWAGFQWINADDRDRSIISYRRIAKNGKELIMVLNFTPETYENFALPVPQQGVYTELFNSDDKEYGGSGVTNTGALLPSSEENGQQLVHFRMPPLGAVILHRTEQTLEEKKKSRRSKKTK